MLMVICLLKIKGAQIPVCILWVIAMQFTSPLLFIYLFNFYISLFQGLTPKDLFINFLEWRRVPEPKSPEDAVPVSGAPITHEKDKKGE